MRKYISISENRNECYRRGEGGLRPKTKPISGVWMNVIAEGKADFVRQKKTSFGKRSRLVILVML